MFPVYPIVAVLQRVGDNIHLRPQRLGSLCYDTCDLLNLGQLYLKPLVHVIILWRRWHRARDIRVVLQVGVGSYFNYKKYLCAL